MRLRSLYAAALVAGASAVAPFATTPARAITVTPESNSILVSNQSVSGCTTTNDRVLIADATTGGILTNVGRPATVTGVLNEAKPLKYNRKILAVWGGRSNGELGGVGIYNRATQAWETAFSFPSSWERDGNSAHSAAQLDDGSIAVVTPGWIAGTGTARGWVVIFDSSGAVKDTDRLDSAHGVEWDPTRESGALFAIGWKSIVKFRYEPGNRTIEPVHTDTLPVTPKLGGHDIRRRRVNNDFLITMNDASYVYSPDATTKFTPLTKSDGTSLGNGVKSVDERFDGRLNYSFYPVARMFFGDGTSVPMSSCVSPYKSGRWIWNAEQPEHPEEQQSTNTPADPFLWAKELLTATTAEPIGSVIWAGSAADKSHTSVRDNIDRQQNATPSQIPYVMFYHFGDDGNPTMSQVGSATPEQINAWVAFAEAIAKAIGRDEPAYVVIESEYDSPNIPGNQPMCSAPFKDGFRRVVNAFRTYANGAKLVNSPGLWRASSEYDCVKDVMQLVDLHGFPYHTVADDPNCTRRQDGSHYQHGKPTAADAASRIVPEITSKANVLRQKFGGSKVLVTDLAVTRCSYDSGWGDTGQRDVFQALIDAIPQLYEGIGLRGVQIRTGGPPIDDRYLGIENEGQFTWSSQTSTAVTGAKSSIQSYLGTIGGTGTPDFSSTVTAPASAAPSSTAAIRVTVTNTRGSLANGRVKLEIRNSANTIVNSTSWTQTFVNGDTKSFDHTWSTPATTGTYSMKVGVFSNDWATLYDWNDTAGTITIGTAEPAFTSTAAASPASVATGGSTTITASLTNTGGALSNGVVTVEVYSPSGTIADRKTWEAQSIAAGATPAYSLTWTAPATAGTYGVRVGVSGAGGTPQYHFNGGAGSVTVTAGRFTSSATATRLSVMPGRTTTITATIQNVGSALTDGIVDLEMYDSASVRVGQHSVTGQSIAAGASATYSWTWTAPATTGTYVLRIGVFGAGWTPTYHWNGGALTMSVAGANFETGASATPSTVAPGGSTTITATVVNNGGALDGGIVDVEVYNSAGTRLLQQFWSGQTIVNGEVKTYTHTWTAPTTLGTYTVKVGVMGAGWTPTYDWNDNADKVTVANPTFTSTATTSASTVLPGGSVTIDADFTATGGALVNGVTQIKIYNPSGVAVAQSDVTGRNVADGATVRHSYTWSVGATAPTGTYTIRLGVFSAGYGSTYHWNNTGGTVSVGGTFQPSFTVGSGANGWWIEVYTSNDVTGVDAIGKNGAFYLPLVKRSWGAWAATAPSEIGSSDLVQFVARRSTDGATAGSTNFTWLTGSPATEPGWACSFTVGAGASTSRVEVVTSTTATLVEVKVGTGAFTALTQGAPGVWAKTMTVPAGSKVIFRATRSGGAKAYSPVYNWLQ